MNLEKINRVGWIFILCWLLKMKLIWVLYDMSTLIRKLSQWTVTKTCALFLRVNAEVKHNPTNSVVCRVQGEWNGVLEFTYTSGDTRVVDVTKLPVTRKRVRPNELQGPYESR